MCFVQVFLFVVVDDGVLDLIVLDGVDVVITFVVMVVLSMMLLSFMCLL